MKQQGNYMHQSANGGIALFCRYGVSSLNRGVERLARKVHGHLAAALDDMGVGDGRAGGIDQETAAGTFARGLARCFPPGRHCRLESRQERR